MVEELPLGRKRGRNGLQSQALWLVRKLLLEWRVPELWGNESPPLPPLAHANHDVAQALDHALVTHRESKGLRGHVRGLEGHALDRAVDEVLRWGLGHVKEA